MHCGTADAAISNDCQCLVMHVEMTACGRPTDVNIVNAQEHSVIAPAHGFLPPGTSSQHNDDVEDGTRAGGKSSNWRV